MRFNRRELLSGLGVGAATTLLTALGCGSTASKVRPGRDVGRTSADVRAWLRGAVEQLRTEYPIASAHAIDATRVTAALDLAGHGVVRAHRAAVVVRVEDERGQIIERAISELTRDAIGRIVVALRRGRTRGRGLQVGTPRRDGPDRGADRSDVGWIDLVDALARRAEALTSSRVLYRGAWYDTDDATVWHVSDGVDREQRLVRSRAGVVIIAWGGTRPLVGETTRGVAGGPEDVGIADADLDRTAAAALELTTPGVVPSGAAIVILQPSAVARLVDAAIAPLATTPAWARADSPMRTRAGQRIGQAAITLRADPDPRRYGGYYFDDEGVAATPTPLIDGGIVRGPVGDRRGAAALSGATAGAALRPGHTGPARASIGHVAWTGGGGVSSRQLHESVDDGWIVDDAVAAYLDPATWTVTIAARRARRIHRGARTGHVYADVEVTAPVPALLADVTRVSTDTELFAFRDGDGADAAWRSVEVPAIVTRATLAPRGAKETR